MNDEIVNLVLVRVQRDGGAIPASVVDAVIAGREHGRRVEHGTGRRRDDELEADLAIRWHAASCAPLRMERQRKAIVRRLRRLTFRAQRCRVSPRSADKQRIVEIVHQAY
jgi:hypothetical protein